jgi:glutaredoxin
MIIFASMEGCGHCKNAKQALFSEISSGNVKVITPVEAQSIFKQKLSGFPAFKNMDNGKEVVGFRSVEDLMNRLEYHKEKYHHKQEYRKERYNNEQKCNEEEYHKQEYRKERYNNEQKCNQEEYHHKERYHKDSSIVFYKMPSCSFCNKAMKLLENEINNGIIIVKDFREAPKEANGFPYFLNLKNNKSYSGLPRDVSDLYNNLGYNVEGFLNPFHQKSSSHQNRENYNYEKPLEKVWSMQGIL